jgi:hypothetical protein
MNRSTTLSCPIGLAAMFALLASSGKSRRDPQNRALNFQKVMSMNKLSIVLKSAAIFLALMVLAQDVKAQSCPPPYFCSRTSTGSADECGFYAWTYDANGVWNIYLREEIVATGSLDSYETICNYAQGYAAGGFSVHIVASIDPFNYCSFSNSFSGSVNESGLMCVLNPYNPSYAFSITGTLVVVDCGNYYEDINYYVPDWNICSCWQTIGNRCSPFDGTFGTSGGTFYPSPFSMATDGRYNQDPNLSDFYASFTPPYGTSAVTETSAVYSENDDYDFYTDCGSMDEYGNCYPAYKNYSLTQTATLSVPYTPEILAGVINSTAPPFDGPWTDPSSSLAASFSMTTNANGVISGSGTKMEYRVAVPASEKGRTYRFQWFETTRDANGNVLSKAKRTCSVVGTGDPANPALSDIFIVPVPSQPGTVVAEGLTPSNEGVRPPPLQNPPLHSPPVPPLLPLPAGGGR